MESAYHAVAVIGRSWPGSVIMSLKRGFCQGACISHMLDSESIDATTYHPNVYLFNISHQIGNFTTYNS
jgi:hypothetical protein